MPLEDWGYVPTAGELELLRAALGRAPLGDAGVALLRSACEGRADPGIPRLLPLLHRNEIAGVPPDLKAHLQRSYHASAISFMTQEREAEPIIGALASAGIPSLLFKGFALARTAYANPAHRPTGDLDVAVPKPQFEAAMTVLERLGFERRLERSLEPGAGMHAATFDDPKGGIGVDLHLNLLLCSRWPGADDGFWSRAEPLTLRSATASVPSPADHLLQTCLHGYRDNLGVTPIRWMLDAVKLLDHAGADFRWDVFLDVAKAHRCGPLLHAALGYVADNLDAAVDATAMTQLAAMPMSRTDRAYFRLEGSDEQFARSPRARARRIWLDYRRQHMGRSLSPAHFAGWMAARWGKRDAGTFFGEALRRVQPRQMPPRPERS